MKLNSISSFEHLRKPIRTEDRYTLKNETFLGKKVSGRITFSTTFHFRLLSSSKSTFLQFVKLRSYLFDKNGLTITLFCTKKVYLHFDGKNVWKRVADFAKYEKAQKTNTSD